MKRLIAVYGAFVALAMCQAPVAVNLSTPAPPAPSATAVVSGNPGNAQYNYWVIANYPGGSATSAAALVQFAPATLTVSNFIQIGWTPLPGVTSYDVVRLTPPAFFSGICTVCKVASGLTANSVNDTGAALTNYSTGLPAVTGNGSIYINTREYTPPQMRQIVNGVDAPIGTGTGMVTSVGAAAPIQSTGGVNPVISCPTCAVGTPGVTVDQDGTAIGTRAIQNFVTGQGMNNAITDTGTAINLQIQPSNGVWALRSNLQSGASITLTETSSSSSVYTWTMTPTLTAYPTTNPLWTWHVGTSCSGGAITGNEDTLGAHPIVMAADASNPPANVCATGQDLIVSYDSSITSFVIMGVIPKALPNGTTATTQATGDASTDVATDSWVSAAIAYFTPYGSVQAGTITVLPFTPTYNNGTSGVGATLTAGSNGTLVIDGYTVLLNDRVLVKNQAAALQNGVYTLTTLGTGGAAYVLTRATDYNSLSDINFTGDILLLNGGQTGQSWYLNAKITAVGTSALNYTQDTAATNSQNGNVKATGNLANGDVIQGAGGKTISDTGVPFSVIPRTNVSNTYSTGTQDASGATHTLPAVKGLTSAKPATCTTGELYFATDATAGQNIYECSSTNTWTQQLDTTSSAGGIISYSGPSLSTVTGTIFCPAGGGGTCSGTEVNVDLASSSQATITNLSVQLSGALGAGNSVAVTWRKNGVSQSSTCTISGASSTSCLDTTHSFNVSQGDLLDYQLVFSGTILVNPFLSAMSQFGTTQSGGTVNSGVQNQVAYYAANGTAVSGHDHPSVLTIPFADCNAGTAGMGPSTASSNFTAVCRAGSNNLGGAAQAIPSTGASLQFMLELPQDWDTATQPYINVYFAAGTNTSGTVIWTASSACVDVSTNGGATDDPAFNAESAFTTRTMTVANRMWYTGGQFTAVTSGNGCKALSPIIVKLALSGTASANINAYQAVVTISRLPVVQAN